VYNIYIMYIVPYYSIMVCHMCSDIIYLLFVFLKDGYIMQKAS
jgi:hypothetical protein